MEQVFVKQIFNLTAKILGNTIDLDIAERKLQTALNHARRYDMQHYEAETLNTMGILHGLRGNTTKEMYYFSQAYEFLDSINDDDHDFLLKITNNMGSAFIGAWQIERGREILMRGVERINAEGIDFLASVYIYSNLLSTQILSGDFETADDTFQRAWQLAERVKIKNYSRIEYFIIVMELHRQKLMIDIAFKRKDAVNDRFALTAYQLTDTGRDDIRRGFEFVRLYQAVICDDDDGKADEIATSLLDDNGQLAPAEALNAGYFFMHTGQSVQAMRYAQRVIDLPDDADDAVLVTMKQHAAQILQGQMST